MKCRNRLFDWDRSYQIQPEVTLQFECGLPIADLAAPTLNGVMQSSSETLDIDWRNPGVHSLLPIRLRLTPVATSILLAFARSTTPRQVFTKWAKDGGWSKMEFENILGILICRRFISGCAETRPSPPAADDCGVALIGIGSKYIRLACTAADTIKAGNPSLPIGIIHEEAESKLLGRLEGRRNLFDRRIACRRDDYRVKGVFSPAYMKVHLDKLSPFSRTIFVDADSIIFPESDLTQEFVRFGRCDFAPACSMVFDPNDTALDSAELSSFNVGILRSLFGLTRPIYRIHSYFMFFRKNAATAALFRTCRSLYVEASKCEDLRQFFGSVSDEPIFSAAASVQECNIYSGYYMPLAERIHWAQPHGLPLSYLRSRFLGFTIVENELPPWLLEAYNTVARDAAQRRGISRAYSWQGKEDSSSGPAGPAS